LFGVNDSGQATILKKYQELDSQLRELHLPPDVEKNKVAFPFPPHRNQA
jgi:hypothetical protein